MGIHSVRGWNLQRRRSTKSKREYINSNSNSKCVSNVNSRNSSNRFSNKFLRLIGLLKLSNVYNNRSRRGFSNTVWAGLGSRTRVSPGLQDATRQGPDAEGALL